MTRTMMQMTNTPARQRGVTLVELMIVVVIVGILAAIAYPSYRAQVMRSTRTEARVALEQRALALEKCYTRFLTYDNPNCAASQAAANGLTPDRHYMVTYAADPANGGFTLTATAQGPQVNDAGCATIRINARGGRTPAACW